MKLLDIKASKALLLSILLSFSVVSCQKADNQDVPRVIKYLVGEYENENKDRFEAVDAYMYGGEMVYLFYFISLPDDDIRRIDVYNINGAYLGYGIKKPYTDDVSWTPGLERFPLVAVFVKHIWTNNTGWL